MTPSDTFKDVIKDDNFFDVGPIGVRSEEPSESVSKVEKAEEVRKTYEPQEFFMIRIMAAIFANLWDSVLKFFTPNDAFKDVIKGILIFLMLDLSGPF